MLFLFYLQILSFPLIFLLSRVFLLENLLALLQDRGLQGVGETEVGAFLLHGAGDDLALAGLEIDEGLLNGDFFIMVALERVEVEGNG